MDGQIIGLVVMEYNNHLTKVKKIPSLVGVYQDLEESGYSAKGKREKMPVFLHTPHRQGIDKRVTPQCMGQLFRSSAYPHHRQRQLFRQLSGPLPGP